MTPEQKAKAKQARLDAFREMVAKAKTYGKNQGDVARAINVSEAWVSRIMNGQFPSVANSLALEKMLRELDEQ